jgi:hypothetical protein
MTFGKLSRVASEIGDFSLNITPAIQSESGQAMMVFRALGLSMNSIGKCVVMFREKQDPISSPFTESSDLSD